MTDRPNRFWTPGEDDRLQNSVLTDQKSVPRRIQRTTLMGWTKPPNTVYVGRGSKWASPYSTRISVGGKTGGKPRRLTAEEAAARYRSSLPYILNNAQLDISELRGKSVMCWCNIDT